MGNGLHHHFSLKLSATKAHTLGNLKIQVRMIMQEKRQKEYHLL